MHSTDTSFPGERPFEPEPLELPLVLPPPPGEPRPSIQEIDESLPVAPVEIEL